MIDADTNQVVPGYQTLADGAVIDLPATSNPRLNIRAHTNSSKVGSVRFSLDGKAIERMDNSRPFSLFGDSSGKYAAGRLPPGKHILRATPYTEGSGQGTSGASLTISFQVMELGPSPTPVPTATPSPTVTPEPTAKPSVAASLRNISARAYAGGDEKQLISGFIIAGKDPKPIVLRARGPSLSAFGLSNVLADPMIELYDSTGALIASNDNWSDSQALLFAVGGTYDLFRPDNDLEPALAIELPPGSYSAILHGKNGGRGLALTEVYDVSVGDASQLVNISTRALVAPGDNVLIGGFVASGQNGVGVILRALGPSLLSSGLAPILSDPSLALFDENGDLVRFDEDWQDDSEQANQLSRSGLSPNYPQESAMVVHLAPGNYTAVVRGPRNSSGIALLEAYSLP